MSTKAERSELSRVSPSPNTLRALAVLLFLIGAAHSQTVPYIDDIVGKEDIEVSVGKRGTEDGDLSLIGTFKVYNPDTIPFYIWISFENGGRFTHSRYKDTPTIRMVDMELRYRDAAQRPIIKEFPDNAAPRVRQRLGWTAPRSASDRRFGRKKAHVERPDDAASSASRRSMGAVEIAFWQEDVQAYYEMELWGVLYAPDLKKAVVAGNYVENIKFEIEPAAR